MSEIYETPFGGRPLSIEIGKVARQSNGSCLVRYGETVVLVTANKAKTIREGIDFLPLTVDYLEKTFAAGKIPGGFFKREGRPSENEILTCRLIDRPLRPLFPDNYTFETQIIAVVLSVDQENSPDIPALIGASAALMVSDIPFKSPIGAARIGKIKGELILNPSQAQLEESELDMIVAGTKDAIIMVEGVAKNLPESDILRALEFAHNQIKEIARLQEDMASKCGKPKQAVPETSANQELVEKVRIIASEKLSLLFSKPTGKKERIETVEALAKEAVEGLKDEFPENEVLSVFYEFEKSLMRAQILNEKKRVDGRAMDEVRTINCDISVLPRTHGSALFTRGETQAIVIVTLGTSEDEQIIDALEGESSKRYMLHYNFHPFCTGEVKPLRGPSRREVGHGNLAERALNYIIPPKEKFPYTIRIVSEILESNGSSSMASICGGSLSLMDAGVPVNEAVAGVAMGLIKEEDKVAILTDILGDEDHLGDMDFKVAGTKTGITAFQMDIKISGINWDIMERALEQARIGRLHILDKMNAAIDSPKENLSIHAPRIYNVKVKPEKIREIIGPGGKVIKSIIEKTGVKIDIEDTTGTVNIASADSNAAKEAIKMIQDIIKEAEVGQIYLGKVKKIVDFGAFVEIIPGTDGLLHISQISTERVKNIYDFFKEGDEVMVKVIEIDKQGKIKLSRKEALQTSN